MKTGRPKKAVKLPRKQPFTLADFYQANGVNLTNGKGENVSGVHVRKFVKMLLNVKIIELAHGLSGKPNSPIGYGRKPIVYRYCSDVVLFTEGKRVSICRSKGNAFEPLLTATY